MVNADDPRVKKLLSFKSLTREDLAVLVVTGTDKLEQLRSQPPDSLDREGRCTNCGGYGRKGERCDQCPPVVASEDTGAADKGTN